MLREIAEAFQERRVIEATMARTLPKLLLSLKSPSIAALMPHLMPIEAILQVAAPGWEAYAGEYAQVEALLRSRYDQTGALLTYPQVYGAGALTSRLLYLMVRTRRPGTVLETGVANGHTTLVLLEALRLNDAGELHSTDVAEGVGGLLNKTHRRRWHFHRLDRQSARREFVTLLGHLPALDLFFHDSEHRFGWQEFEYGAAQDHLAEGGLLGSDDVDSSYAFLKFCTTRGHRPALLLDGAKVSGWALPRTG
jgi:predicted O-methyltransferase YrrM